MRACTSSIKKKMILTPWARFSPFFSKQRDKSRFCLDLTLLFWKKIGEIGDLARPEQQHLGELGKSADRLDLSRFKSALDRPHLLLCSSRSRNIPMVEIKTHPDFNPFPTWPNFCWDFIPLKISRPLLLKCLMGTSPFWISPFIVEACAWVKKEIIFLNEGQSKSKILGLSYLLGVKCYGPIE